MERTFLNMSKLLNKFTTLINKNKRNKIYISNDFSLELTIHYLGFVITLNKITDCINITWGDILRILSPIIDDNNVSSFYIDTLLHRDTKMINFGVHKMTVRITVQQHYKIRGIPIELEDIMINLPYNNNYFLSLNTSSLREIFSFYLPVNTNFKILNLNTAQYIDVSQDEELSNFVVIADSLNSLGLELTDDACNRYSHCWRYYLGLDGIETQSFSSRDVTYEIVETTVLSLYTISKCRTKTELAFACCTAIKLFTKKTLWASILPLFNTIARLIVFTESDSVLDDCLNLLDNYTEFKKSEFFTQSYTVLAIMLAQSVSNEILSDGLIKDMHTFGMNTIKESLDFPILITKSIIMIFKRFQQAIALGSLQPIIYDECSIMEWRNEVEFLKLKFPYYSNLIPHQLSVSEFDLRLDNAIQIGETLKRMCGNQGKKVVEYNMAMLNKIKSEIVAINSVSADRLLPFAIELFGVPGVGKSSLVPLLHKVFADIRKLPYGKEYIHTAVKNSDYDDGFKPYKYVWFQDDVGQNHPNRQMGMDLEVTKLINIINRVSMTAVMADVNDKGKLPIAPHLVVVTTNVLDLHTSIYCTDPYAVMRRFNIIVDLKVKSKFSDNEGRLCPDKIENWKGIPDFWDFHLKYATKSTTRTSKNSNDNANMVIVNLPDNASYDIKDGKIDNIKSFLKWYSHKIDTHYNNIALQDESNDVINNMKYCNECFDWDCIHTNPTPCEEQVAIEIDNRYIWPIVLTFIMLAFKQMFVFKNNVTNNILGNTFVETQMLQVGWRFKLLELFFLKLMLLWVHCWEEYFINYFQRNFGRYSIIWVNFVFLIFTIICPIFVIISCPLIIGNLLTLFKDKILEREMKVFSNMTRYVFEDTKAFFRHYLIEKVRGWEFPIALFVIGYASGAVSITINATVVMITTILGLLTPQRSDEQTLKSTEFKDISKENIWRKSDYKLTHKDIGLASSNYGKMSRDEVIHHLSSNVARIFIHTVDDQRVITNIFSLGGSRWIINKHTFSGVLEGEITVDIRYSDRDIIHFKTTTISLNTAMMSENYDAVILDIPAIPPRPNLTKLLMNELDFFKGEFSGFYLGRDNDGNLKITSVKNIMEAQPPTNTSYNKRFLSGVANTPTIKGDCGSLLIVHDGFCAIVGFHTLGSLDLRRPRVWATPISQEVFDLLPTIIPQIGEPNLPINSELVAVHPKSPINYVDSLEDVGVLGSLGGFTPVAKTRVASSPLRSALQVHGIDTELEAPKFKGENKYLPYYRWLTAVSTNSCEIPSNILECAVGDYLSVLLQGDFSSLRMLSTYEAINGLPNCRYIDGIIKSTSAGYYLSGNKSEHLIEDVRDGYPNGVYVKDYVEREINACLASYAKGQTFGFVYSTCLKDEPISREKNNIGKIRVFNACPMSFVIVSRKIFMTFIKFMQENRALSEVAVGINAHGLEWQNLLSYLNHDRPLTQANLDELYLLAGDFKSFDLSMNTTTLIAVKKVIMTVLIHANWSIADLTIAETCLQEMIFKYVKLNCELIKIQHSNPSGNSLTVIINCIANSLYMRSVYYYLHAEKGNENIPLFHTKYRLTTYGDDNVLTTLDNKELLTHITIRDTLAKWNIGYTMAEKDAEFTDYIPLHKTTYLKRNFIYHKDLNIYAAPLNIKSINKMLCIWTYNKNGFDAQYDGVIRSAFYELVFHGREIYNKYYNIIIGILDGQDYDFVHPIDKNIIRVEHFAYWRPPVYDEMLEIWRSKNLGSELQLPASIASQL